MKTILATIGAAALLGLGISASCIAGAGANSMGGAGVTVMPSAAGHNVTVTSLTETAPQVKATFFGKK
jgi:hypothetical protein